MFNPKVSIVIPVYNGSNYLRDAIESALNQTYANIEVLVVNDGSNDKGATRDIALSYGDKIRYFEKENGGVSSALNLGIKEMEGIFFSWLSHDDLYLPEKIEKQIQVLNSNFDDQIILYTDYIVQNMKDDLKYLPTKITDFVTYDYIFDILLSLFQSSIHGCSILIPKSCFEKIGLFDEKLLTTQDYDLWFKFVKYGYRFQRIPEVLMISRAHDDQGMHRLHDIHISEVNDLYIWALDLFNDTFKLFLPDRADYFLKILKMRGLERASAYFSEKYQFGKSESFKKKIHQKKTKRKSPCVLIVGMTSNIHTVRWVNQIIDQGWDIHIAPSTPWEIHPELIKLGITIHPLKNKHERLLKEKFIVDGKNFINAEKYPDNILALNLEEVIKKIQPDVVHTLQIQFAGYLTLSVREKYCNRFPKWIVTNWGQDIHLFGRLKEHNDKIKRILMNCDYYSCESNRDVELANDFGFRGKILPVMPNVGGFKLGNIWKLRQLGKVSERKIILLKGYQGWYGRSLVGLRALERCIDILQGYTIIIYSGHTLDIKIAAELFHNSTGIPVKVLPFITHEEMMSYHGKARISIGLSISDGASISFLEALAMGSFPIQANTASADEWIVDGITGFIVPPEDPDIIEKAIRMALTNDRLVDNASEENWKTVTNRLDFYKIKEQVVNSFYKIVLNEAGFDI